MVIPYFVLIPFESLSSSFPGRSARSPSVPPGVWTETAGASRGIPHSPRENSVPRSMTSQSSPTRKEVPHAVSLPGIDRPSDLAAPYEYPP